MKDLFQDIAEFCGDKFDDSPLESQFFKLREELEELEIRQDPHELADMIVVLINIARIQGWDIEQALSEKFETLKERVWEKQPDGTYHHV
jgi:NTP pyrophosphatase (non-canonical NTP hydrolase)